MFIMVVKTITVTEDAYKALKSLKESGESFSKAILRIAKRKPLSTFFGALSKKSGARLEKAVLDLRKKRNEAHRARIKRTIKAFKGD